MLTNITPEFKLIFAKMDSTLSDLKHFVDQSSVHGVATHEVEKGIFDKVLTIGAQALQYFFAMQGDGDLGETVAVNSEDPFKRLKPRSRQYQSIFGTFDLTRVVYGTYEDKKIEFVPLDSRLQLPYGEHSYLLQEWGQTIAVEVPFKKAMEMLNSIFPISLSVDTLERTNQAMACHIESYKEELRENMEAALENLNEDEARTMKESLLVLSADGKGIPIRHANNQPRIESQQKNKGPKPDRKRMAVVGSSYLVAPYMRTPESVLDALFRVDSESSKEVIEKRPTAIYKAVTANLSREINGMTINATLATFEWLKSQRSCLEGYVDQPPIFLMDGQISLWNEVKRQLSGESCIEILDILHAISYMWDIAHVFYADNNPDRWAFMKGRVLRILQGEIKGVVSGVRQMATKQKIPGNKLKKLEDACQYFEKNAHRMKYDQYLKDGLPIASGVIEGACRHFVKDRMERAGMQWTINGAQAMLDIRAQKLNGDWDEFISHRMKKEFEKNHPYFDLVQQVEWPMAA